MEKQNFQIQQATALVGKMVEKYFHPLTKVYFGKSPKYNYFIEIILHWPAII